MLYVFLFIIQLIFWNLIIKAFYFFKTAFDEPFQASCPFEWTYQEKRKTKIILIRIDIQFDFVYPTYGIRS